MKNVNLSLQVIPVNISDSYPIIDEAIRVIQDSGIKHRVTPFSTVMEGSMNEVMQVVEKAKDASFKAGADELVLNIQVHMKKDKNVSMEEKTGKFE